MRKRLTLSPPSNRRGARPVLKAAYFNPSASGVHVCYTARRQSVFSSPPPSATCTRSATTWSPSSSRSCASDWRTSGKSALLAKLTELLGKSSALVAVHYVGATERSADLGGLSCKDFSSLLHGSREVSFPKKGQRFPSGGHAFPSGGQSMPSGGEPKLQTEGGVALAKPRRRFRSSGRKNVGIQRQEPPTLGLCARQLSSTNTTFTAWIVTSGRSS